MRYLLWIWIATVTTLPLPSQENPMADLEQRLRTLENHLPADLVDRRDLNVLAAQLEKKIMEEHSYFDKAWNRIDRRLGRMEDRWSLIWASGISLLSIIGFTWFYYRKLRKHLDREIEKKFNAKAGTLKRMIDRADQERSIREKEKLLILSKDDTTIVKELRRQRFKAITSERVNASNPKDTTPKSVGEAQHDMVIFDHLDEEFINDYLATSDKTVFLAYYTQPGRQNIKKKELVNFAQSPITLYSGLIAAARYRRLLDREE